MRIAAWLPTATTGLAVVWAVCGGPHDSSIGAARPDCTAPALTDFALFSYLTGEPTARMISYSPSELDPRFPKNHAGLPTASIEADLSVLRRVFDGLVLYGYHEGSTQRIMEAARKLKYRAVLLGIWDPTSRAEVDGVIALVHRYHPDFVLGVIVGNEGITFGRYGPSDLSAAADRLLGQLPPEVPVTTSEPLTVSRNSGFVRSFGDFLAPNIHPVWDQPALPAEEAALWTREQAMKLARKVEKPVLVKETGFPNDGREEYTRKAQRLFWEAYLRDGVIAETRCCDGVWVFHGVAFEAFDLPWKAEDTGIPIEKSWGLFSTDRQEYPALSPWREVAR